MESLSNSGVAPSVQRVNYEEYLKSGHWACLRMEAFNRSNRKCESCRKMVPLQGHHLRYKQLLDCKAEDIMALCDPCHSLWHEYFSSRAEKPRDFVLGFLEALRARPRPKPKTKRKPKSERIRVRGVTTKFFTDDPQFMDACRLSVGAFKRWANRRYLGMENKKKIAKMALDLSFTIGLRDPF